MGDNKIKEGSGVNLYYCDSDNCTYWSNANKFCRMSHKLDGLYTGNEENKVCSLFKNK